MCALGEWSVTSCLAAVRGLGGLGGPSAFSGNDFVSGSLHHGGHASGGKWSVVCGAWCAESQDVCVISDTRLPWKECVGVMGACKSER